MDEQPRIVNVSNFFHDNPTTPRTNVNTEDKPPKVVDPQSKLTQYLLAISEVLTEDPEKAKELTRSLIMLSMSLYARRRIRKALIAVGVDPKAAKTISLGLIWGSYAIAANATTGAAYANFFANSALYPEESE